MGIQGLLPLLKPAHEWKEMAAFEGQTLAVDAYVWLHKGAFGCAEDLVLGRKTTRFVDYCMHRVRLLRHFGVEPYVVFDGGPLPAKAGTETDRLEKRELAKQKALELKQAGRTKEAFAAFSQCIDVTPEMALQLIKALRAESVAYVVAPYEADAQLCFLERQGLVDGVLTEDSDLLVYGCRTVLFKMDADGKVCLLRRDRLGLVGPPTRGLSGGSMLGGEWRLDGWGDAEFRHMAILSGCDYLPSIHGVGLKKAHSLLRRFKTVARAVQHLRLEGFAVPADYAQRFRLAELTFCHQRVFDPTKGEVVPLSPLPDGCAADEDAFIGPNIDSLIAREIAAGDRCPITRRLIIDSWVDFRPGQVPRPVNGSSKVGQAAKRPAAPVVTSQGQLKITEMFKPKPQIFRPLNNAVASSSTSAHPLKRSISAPQPRRPAATATAAQPALHQYAFGQGGAVLASQSGPARLSQLERGAIGLSQLSATARGKLRQIVPDSQVLEEPGLPVAVGGGASRFFGGGGGRRAQPVLAKASSDEPRSSNRSLLTDVGGSASARTIVGSGSMGEGVLLSYPTGAAAVPAVGVVPSSPVDAFDDDDGGSDVSVTPHHALSVASSPSPRKPTRTTITLEDVLSSPASVVARQYERRRDSSIGRDFSDGYISSSPVGRMANGGPAKGRDFIGPPAGAAIDEDDGNDGDAFELDVGPSSDATVIALDLRQICESSPPPTAHAIAEEAAAEKRSNMLQFGAVPDMRASPHSDSSHIRSSSDDDDGGGDGRRAAAPNMTDADDNADEAFESEAAAEAERQRRQANVGASWRNKFAYAGGRKSLPMAALSGTTTTTTTTTLSRPRTNTGSAPRPLGSTTTNVPPTGERKRPRPPKNTESAAAGSSFSQRRTAASQPPKFTPANVVDDSDAGKENAAGAATTAVVRTPPSSPAKRRAVGRGRKRTSDAAALDEADARLEASVSPLRPASKRSSLGSQVPPTWASASTSSLSSDGVELGSSQLSSGSRSKLERLRFRPTAL